MQVLDLSTLAARASKPLMTSTDSTPDAVTSPAVRSPSGQDPAEPLSLPTSRFSLSFITRLLLAGIFAIGLLLRLYCLDCHGLWYDEVASIEVAQRGLQAILTDRFGWMLVQTPLHYLIVWLTIQPVDPATTAVIVRLPSAIAGALTPLLVFGIGRELFGCAQGLLAALLVALSAVHIGSSQDVRPYAILIFLTTFSVYSLLVSKRTGSRRWWAVFALATVANLYMTYFAVTLVLPALAPYLLWLLYKLWRQHSRGRALLLRALAAILVTLIGWLPMVPAILQVPRTPPRLELLSVDMLRQEMTLLVVQLADLGLSGTMQLVTQWGFFLLSLLGIFAAVRARRTTAALLCISFVLIPGLLLGVFKTGNTVFIRYGLFALPFYLLLISNGLLSLWAGLRPVPSTVFKTLRFAAAALVATTVALFALSVYAYFDPAQYRERAYYPDYRSAARYLSQTATRADLIIVNDEPALGYPVFDLYWHGKAPAPTFDARDPRLFQQSTTGSLYWVVSFFQNDPSFLGRLASESNAWKEVAKYDRIVILKEDHPADLRSSMDRMVSKLEEENSRFQPVVTLRGILYQASGDAANAAAAYRSAGSYFQSGSEYLLTAQGYAARGDMAAAWREAIISKFMEPGKPDIHAWLSQSLKEANDTQGSLIEDQISRLLRASQ